MKSKNDCKADEKKKHLAKKMSGSMPSLSNKKDANNLSDSFRRAKPEAK